MSVSHYNTCNRHIGRAVEIRTHDGHIHRGVIERVTKDRVYLRPMGKTRNYGGYGYGWGFGWGFGAGVALGAIASIALIGLFW